MWISFVQNAQKPQKTLKKTQKTPITTTNSNWLTPNYHQPTPLVTLIPNIYNM